MSAEDAAVGPVTQEDLEILKALFDVAGAADDGDVVYADATRAAHVLFAQIAAAKMDPAAVQAIMESERHPMSVRRFAALDASGYTRQSWPRQEERLLKRYANAQERLRHARSVSADAEAKRRDAEGELEEVAIDMALMRLTVMLRGMQEFVRPALEAGPLVSLMLAVLGGPAFAEDGASDDKRAEAKRTLEVLKQRIGDEVFLDKVGHLIRSFVMAYDDEAGAERRLGRAAADRLCEEMLADNAMWERLRAAARGDAAEAGSPSTSQNGENTPVEEDPFEGLPF